ncbi:MAG: hypothetical protein ACFFA8_01710 [Promethearchaeota archaeon]
MVNNFKKNIESIDSVELKKAKNLLGLGLISGGLDSLLACLILKLQNIDIIGLNFKSPFCVCDKAYKSAECGLNLYYDKLGINVHYLKKEDDYLELVKSPKFGYGKSLNPCIDCRIYILKRAKKYAEEIKADLIFTGEVLNQRPKSQNRQALKIIEREAGLEGKLLRPLSALLLEPTIFEKKGDIDRTKLFGINGRSRKIQVSIAQRYGLLDSYYACGGCLLTDKGFSNRMKDYIKYNIKLKMVDISLLKIGRHFRFNRSKIIVGRNELENKLLLQLKNPKDLIMEAKKVVGPITIIQGRINHQIIKFAAKLTLRYSDSTKKYGKIVYGTTIDSLNESIIVSQIMEENLRSHII